MTTERIQLLILDVLAAAPAHLYTTAQLHRDVNGLSPDLVTQTDVTRALAALEDVRPPQIVRVDGGEPSQGRMTRILPAGLARVAAAPRD